METYLRSDTTPTFTNEVPDEIKGWNWGAFFFGWIWGVFNGVYWPLALIVTSFIPYVGVLISLGGRIALGINGSEWAWKAIQWSSVDEFKRIQRKWALAVLWILGIMFLIFLINILTSIVSGNIH